MLRARGFPSQALGPTYLTYGPMLADGDIVFEEWESQIYGANGELYNNQYCWLLRFEGEEVVAMREYNDTHHAALRSEEHTSELQSLMRISYAVFCLKNKNKTHTKRN